jgi:hypothetical protein
MRLFRVARHRHSYEGNDTGLQSVLTTVTTLAWVLPVIILAIVVLSVVSSIPNVLIQQSSPTPMDYINDLYNKLASLNTSYIDFKSYADPLLDWIKTVNTTETATYIVFTDGRMYYAKNGRTGQIDFNGTDATTVIQSALNALTPGRMWKERVLVKGSYIINNSASPLRISSYTIFEVDGRLTALDKRKTLVHVSGSNIELRGGIYDGNRGTEVTATDEPVRVIHVENATDVIIEGVKVVNGYSRGIEVSNGYHVTLKDIYAENSWRNVMIWSDSYTTVRNHELRNIHSKYAQGGSGVDLGTVGYVTIDGLYSEEDNPVALAIDSCKSITARNIISKFRGIALIYAGYNPTEDITIEDATSVGSGAGALLAEVKYIYNINNIVLRNIRVLSPGDTAIIFRRSAGTGTINNVRIYDIYTDGIPSGKLSISADSAVQYIEVLGGRVDRPMSIATTLWRVVGVIGYDTENFKVTGLAVPVGTGGYYGLATTITTPSGRITCPRVKVTWGGAFRARETVTVKVEAVYTDGSTAYIEKPATATGSLWLTDDDILALIAQGKDIVKLNIYAKTNLPSTSVIVTVDAYGKG